MFLRLLLFSTGNIEVLQVSRVEVGMQGTVCSDIAGDNVKTEQPTMMCSGYKRFKLLEDDQREANLQVQEFDRSRGHRMASPERRAPSLDSRG